jgi:hypothetical protein
MHSFRRPAIRRKYFTHLFGEFLHLTRIFLAIAPF